MLTIWSAFISLGCLVIQTQSQVIELSYEIRPQEALRDFDYAVINFYEGNNLHILDVFALTEEHFKRSPSPWNTIGFAQVNLTEYPDLAYKQNRNTLPVQYIFTRGRPKLLNFTSNDQEPKAWAADRFIYQVNDATASKLTDVDCETLFMLIRESKTLMFVYVGQESELEQAGSSIATLHQVSTYDRFVYPESKVLFFINSDEQCKKRLNLNKGATVVLYANKNIAPFILEGPAVDFSANSLFHWISHSIAQFELKWNRRTYSTIINKKVNALVYITNKAVDEQVWVFDVVKEAQELIRFNIGNLFVIVTPFEDETISDELAQLSLLMEVEQDNVPGIFVMHGEVQGGIQKFPYEFTRETLSAELLIHWARQALLLLERPELQNYISELKSDENASVDELEYFENVFNQGEKQIEVLGKEINEILSQLGGKKAELLLETAAEL